MRRGKLGDVYAVKVPNGYKLYQWAYSIPRDGDYIRVFGGLYDTIPDNVEDIVAGSHSYIISFYSNRAYRIGLSAFVENLPVPDRYPFPGYKIRFCRDMYGHIWQMDIMPTQGTIADWRVFPAAHIADLPSQYQDITLLNHCVSPDWLLYLFDIDFDLSEPERFFPAIPGENSNPLKIYTDMVNEALERAGMKKL